ncbi:hypothetical protein FOMPIDRAFT_1130371 [Fomitopsis schrenkii]|uniref:Uncharacterized protein n=1 Tax=Fomitopsis schrenkii TaxID=2126942 RepID=S8FD97_FOMSC|nr:hypothetical protein FOMPIDRAFT_1130371 [Fomitopsis schrenkii]
MSQLNSSSGSPCDATGSQYLPSNANPPPRDKPQQGDWTPFRSRLEFEVAEFLYKKDQMSQGHVTHLMDLWAASLVPYGGNPPFTNCDDMLANIDAIAHRDAPWHCFEVSYTGPLPEGDVPSWMTEKYLVWTRDILAVLHIMISNEDFNGEFDYTPYAELSPEGRRILTNLMSGNWAWRQADKIAEDPTTYGAMFVPVILGSDKTTVSVATGQNEYYPLYVSIGNVHNGVRRAHRNAVHVLAFLAIAKCDKKHKDTEAFRLFKRQLYHTSVSKIPQPLRTVMENPEVVRCPDSHFRRAIYGIGPNLLDYPEQALAAGIVEGWCPVCLGHHNHLDCRLAAGRRSEELREALVGALDKKTLWDEYGIVASIIPYTNNFPRADIHELLSGDLLHQIIKPFKDHVVDWITEWITLEYGEAGASIVMSEIDRRLAVVPPFTGLRRFRQGRNFKQWTGDDSKALMKIYLAAIKGLVPGPLVRMVRAYLEYTYLIRHPIQDEDTLARSQAALAEYHEHREFLRTSGVRPEGFSIPRQHSHSHTARHTWNFAALHGLCTSITENKHIKAVKEPWRRSNHYEALGQMLLTNQRLDKLAAARVDFAARGMLDGTCYAAALLALVSNNNPGLGEGEEGRTDDQAGTTIGNEPEGAVEGPQLDAYVELARRSAPGYPRTLAALGAHLHRPELTGEVARFLATQYGLDPSDPATDLAQFTKPFMRVRVHHSAVVTYHAPGDPSGVGGMRREHIRATPSWRLGAARYDCAFVNKDPAQAGFRGLHAARIRLFLSFKFESKPYESALIEWFVPVGDEPDEDTGMWVVQPEYNEDGESQPYELIHVDAIYRSAHLIGFYGDSFVPTTLVASDSLDAFDAFFVNKWIDYHAHEHVH